MNLRNAFACSALSSLASTTFADKAFQALRGHEGEGTVKTLGSCQLAPPDHNIHALADQVAENTANITSLEAQVAALNAQVAALEARFDAHDAQVAAHPQCLFGCTYSQTFPLEINEYAYFEDIMDVDESFEVHSIEVNIDIDHGDINIGGLDITFAHLVNGLTRGLMSLSYPSDYDCTQSVDNFKLRFIDGADTTIADQCSNSGPLVSGCYKPSDIYGRTLDDQFADGDGSAGKWLLSFQQARDFDPDRIARLNGWSITFNGSTGDCPTP